MNSKIARLFLICFTTLYFLSCKPTKQMATNHNLPAIVTTAIPTDSNRTDVFLENLLKQYPTLFDSILVNRNQLNVQIIYTQVDRGANGNASLKNYFFNVNPSRYFYPASTVKLPTVLLALQRLNELKDKGIDKNSSMITETAFAGQTAVYNDPTTPDGRPTIAHYIKKILLVSDNDAFNRLYEFMGPAYINKELHKKGYEDVQILHRLQIALKPEENRHTNPVIFMGPTGNILYKQDAQYDTTQYLVRHDFLGKAYMGNDYAKGEQLVNEPMNFSGKNRISLEDLHTILISLIFPNKVHANQRFNLSTEDRNFVLKYMSMLPTQSKYPPYASDTNYFPAYGKFLLFGASKGDIPSNIRIFNKIGDAYGQMLDVAYIIDLDKKIEFFLSAVIYCNSDGIMNDDKYDYNNVGLPFMKNLGQVIYEYEVKRPRNRAPDLEEFRKL